MKIFYSTFILMLFTTIMFIGISLKAQIHSTTAGGSWNDPNTWVEEIVPGADDDVVINGPVNTNGNLCNDLTITSNGVLNNTFNDATLYVGGNIINEGTICNYAYYFYLNVGGDITNNGTWTNRITYLTGTELHSLSQNGDAEFSGYEFNVEEGTGQVNVLSDFNFKNTRILLNGGIIELDNSKGANLYIDGSFIVNGSLHANNNEVHLDQGAYFENFNLQDANLNGIIIIKGNNNVFSGNTILTGTLKNDYYEYNLSIYDDFTNNGLINSYGNSFYINMYGNIANNGEIINSSGALYFDIYGNIVNNGTWNNNSIELGGESDQNISCLNENAFEVDDFIDQQPLGLINALTDLYFINTDINLNNDTLLMPNNSTLSILNNYITNSVVYSPDGRITLNMNSSAYINNCKISDVNLNGKIECKNTDFYGEIILNGEMYNEYSAYTVNIDGNITNNGSIHDYANYLNLNVSGDIINNGIWSNRLTYLTGIEPHILSQNGEVEFSGYEFNAEEGTGLISLISDFNFNNTRVILNGGTMELDNSKGGNLFINRSFIIDGILIANNKELYLGQNAYIQDFSVQNSVLRGIIEIRGDNVVFSGNTILTDTLRNDYSSYNLSIYDNFTNNGLINSYATSFYIDMYGNIVNNAVIDNSSGALYFDIYGDIVNNGVWNSDDIELIGESDQNISCLNENIFEVDDFIDQQPFGLINALTDLYFINTDINLNNDTLLMPNNSTLSILNNYITNSVVYSPDGRITLNMNSSAYINNCKISDVNLNGKIECKNTDFYGEIILNGEMYNEYSTHSVNINGNITNNGSIHDYAYYLNLNVSGDIINNGIWSNRLTYLTGIEPHILSQNGEVEFSGYEFNAEEGTGLISLMSNFNFNNTRVILNGGTMELDNSKGGNLFIHGSFIVNGNLIANNNELYLGQNAYIQDFSVQNSVLRGIIEIRGDNVVFSGNTILTDTLQNDYNNYNLSIFDDFTNNGLINNYGLNLNINVFGNITNNGIIQSLGAELHFDIYGNIVNNGTWNNNSIELRGESDQSISCINESIFDVDNFSDEQAEGLIIALSDLYFIDCNFNLNNDTLLMPNNSTLSILNNYITNSVVYSPDGRFALNMNNSAFVQDCIISDVDIYGKIECKNTDFYGEIILNGEMCDEYYSCIVNIDGDITNNGSIHDYVYGMTINLSGDIINNGEWDNYQTLLNGTDNQHVYLINGNEITGQFRLLSDIQVSPFQWYLNGEPITDQLAFSGWNSNTLIFNTPVSEWLGVYYCSTGGGASRNIIIETESPIADFIADVTSGYNPLEVCFEDISPQSYSEIIEWSWDFGDGNTSSLQNPTNVYENHGTYTVSLTITDVNQLTDTKTKIDYIIVSLSGGQIIELIDGYSFVSTRIMPENADLLAVCDDILPNLDFVRNTAGDMLRKIGPMWINSIGELITTEGYLFRMNNADELIILGEIIDPQTPITLTSGYQFTSYLPENPMDVLTAFTNVLDNLDFVRNTSGSMLRKIGPNWVNGIGEMNPGEGYLVRMLNPDELIYPVSGEKFTGITKSKPVHFVFEGGNAADPVFTIYIEGLNIGDEVAAYEGGKIIGSVVINSQNAFDNDLAVFNTINSGHGYQAGKPIQLKVWDSFKQKTSIVEYEMIDPYTEAYMHEVYPGEDGLYSIIKISNSSNEIENIENEISIYPNPAIDKVNIVSNETIKDLQIFNILGKVVLNVEVNNEQTIVNTSEFQSGVYILKINTDKSTFVKKVTVK